jgi:hypothetical protein
LRIAGFVPIVRAPASARKGQMMNLSNVQLVRNVSTDGVERTICLKFTGSKGCVVSLSFDTRANISGSPGGVARHVYGVYTDCPVCDCEGVHSVDARPGAVISDLRNALDDLNVRLRD